MKKVLLAFSCLLIIVDVYSQSTPKVITTRSEKEVIPEGITINPANGTIYVSSINLKKILAINNDGPHKDFIKTGEHDLCL